MKCPRRLGPDGLSQIAPHRRGVGGLVDFMLEHHLPAKFEEMTTHRFRITEAAEAFRVADEGKSGKVMFVWD